MFGTRHAAGPGGRPTSRAALWELLPALMTVMLLAGHVIMMRVAREQVILFPARTHALTPDAMRMVWMIQEPVCGMRCATGLGDSPRSRAVLRDPVRVLMMVTQPVGIVIMMRAVRGVDILHRVLTLV